MDHYPKIIHNKSHNLWIWLAGGRPTPLKNDGVKVSWDDEIPNRILFFIGGGYSMHSGIMSDITDVSDFWMVNQIPIEIAIKLGAGQPLPGDNKTIQGLARAESRSVPF